MKQRTQYEIARNQIFQEFHKFYGEALAEMEAKPRLKKRGEELITKAQENRQRVSELRDQSRTLRRKKKREAERILIDHFIGCLDSIEARLILQTSNEGFTSKEFFDLKCRIHGIPEEIPNPVAAYHRAVRNWFSVEEMRIPSRSMPRERLDYIESVTSLNHRLKELASQTFGREIYGRIDVDVKEKQSHNFLGWTNVGFSSLEIDLISTIAHEGPFGHQAQNQLSERYPNNFHYMMSLEGIAILGQRIALEKYYNRKELAQARLYKRLVYDTIGAAIERLSVEGYSTDKMAEVLASEYYSKQFLKDHLSNTERPGSRMVTPVALNYFLGYEYVSKIYDDAMKKIKEADIDETGRVQKEQLLHQRLYTGVRHPKIMQREVDLYVFDGE